MIRSIDGLWFLLFSLAFTADAKAAAPAWLPMQERCRDEIMATAAPGNRYELWKPIADCTVTRTLNISKEQHWRVDACVQQTALRRANIIPTSVRTGLGAIDDVFTCVGK